MELSQGKFQKNAIKAYEWIFAKFVNNHGHKDLKEITSEEVLAFLKGITEGKKQQTRVKLYMSSS